MLKEYYKIVFLILHYYTIDDTIKCVTSIKERIDTNNYEIVIVDNGSPNGSGQELKKKYEKDENIHILINDKNLGFANGNNLGFEYAKKQLKADFIVMLNNDTILLRDNFIEVVSKEYEYSHFAVMGPKILLPEDRICYYPENLISRQKLKKNIRKSFIYMLLEYLYVGNIVRVIKKCIKMDLKDNKNYYNKEDIEEKTKNRKEDIVLHGCFLIFSPEYISCFNGLDNRTFLYKEEQLLYIRIKKNGLKSVYNPELVIFHNESSATKSTNKNLRSKNLLTHKNQIKSSLIVLDEIKTL